VVLLLCSGSSLHTWEKWIAILSKDFKVITLDLPAFGLTGPHPDSDYSMEAYSLFLDNFLSKLHVDSCYLVGNSFGGHVAWTYTLDYPERVKKLAILNSSGYPGKATDEVPLIYRLARNPIASKLLMKCTPRALVEKSVNETFVKTELVTEAMIDRYYDLSLRTGNRQAFVDRLKQSNKDFTPRLKELDLPVLIMWGDKDIVIGPEYAKRFQSDITGAETIMYEQVGHLPMEEIPMRSAVDLKAFLWKGDSQKTQLTTRGEEAAEVKVN